MFAEGNAVKLGWGTGSSPQHHTQAERTRRAPHVCKVRHTSEKGGRDEICSPGGRQPQPQEAPSFWVIPPSIWAASHCHYGKQVE